MPRPKSLKPTYCRDKSSGRAFVTLNGKRVYLGAHGTAASRDEYDRVIGEWIASGRSAKGGQTSADLNDGPTVALIINRFWHHARDYYRDGDRVAEEAYNYRDALRPLLRLYGRTPAREFGPLALKALRDEMIRLKWCRTYINRQMLRTKHVFRWAVENELLPPGVYEGLRSVSGLRAGKSTARERDKVKPVDVSHAAALYAFLSPQVQAMVDLQALTGMRPGEACAMRGCDIDTTGKPWKYRPATHKTAHRGHERVIDLGPQSRAIVERFLKPDLTAYLFDPGKAAQARRDARHAARKTPLTCGNRPGSNRKGNRKRPPGRCYDVAAYRRAIKRACDRAFPPPAAIAQRDGESRKQWLARLTNEQRVELKAWHRRHQFHPHQLRHTAATRWRQEFGAEATLVLLGDRTTRMVDVYAERDRAAAAKIMEKIG